MKQIALITAVGSGTRLTAIEMVGRGCLAQLGGSSGQLPWRKWKTLGQLGSLGCVSSTPTFHRERPAVELRNPTLETGVGGFNLARRSNFEIGQVSIRECS